MPRGDDLVFLHGRATERCDAVVDKHFVGYHTLQYMTAGAVDLSYDARAYRLKGRWFWTAYPGPLIRFRAATGHAWWTHRYIAFTGPLAARWRAQGLFPREPQPAPTGRDYRNRFDELIALALRGDRWGKLRAANLLESLLLELAEARAQDAVSSSSQGKWLDAALEYLSRTNDDAPKPADYARLAATLGMGLSTLRRRFREATGTPLHAYALQCRVAAARDLLGESDLPVKTIARRLGYQDVYFFSRQFRQLTGIPPGAYRRSRQK
ncbi:MAG: helix-turn-helix domain-containing protein [Tepidisphaeraceae bacterium]